MWVPCFSVQNTSGKEKFQMQFQLENEKAKKIGEIGKIEMMLENEKNSSKRLEEEVGIFSKLYTVAVFNMPLDTKLCMLLIIVLFVFWAKLRLREASFHSLYSFH